jgi:hypothetical protein
METTEIDTTQEVEAPSPNGHDATWQTFADDNAFLEHIIAQRPAEEVVKVPEWRVEVLCRALNAEHRIALQVAAYDDKTKRTDFRRVFHLIVIHGCYNPATDNPVFSEKHKDILMQQQDGAAIERLAMTILRLSGMLAGNAENAKKN